MANGKRNLELKIIPMTLGIFIIVSIGVNIYFYNKSQNINRNISNIQSEVENRASDNKEITSQVDKNKESLSDIQTKNSELSKKVKK